MSLATGYIFHEFSFKLARLDRLSISDSDHFPVFVELCHEHTAEAAQKRPQPAREDLEVA
jgi:hypothetical protein